jgi:hypothetical protein
MSNRPLRSALLCLLPLLAAGITGCSGAPSAGPPLGTLQGPIILDSEPVLMGSVVASPMDPNYPTVTGVIRRDGTYVIEKVVSGPVRLSIELPPMPRDLDPRHAKGPPRKGGPKPEKGELPQSLASMGLPEEELKAWQSVLKIPKAYLNPQRPILLAFVQPGEEPTEFPLHLSSKPPGSPDPEDLPGDTPPPPPPPR